MNPFPRPIRCSSFSTTLTSSSSLIIFLFISFFHRTAKAGFDVTPLSFGEGFAPLFGDGNVVPSDDGYGVRLLLDRYTGAGFISSNMYQHGFYSAMIKLPAKYTAGVVVAFYTSNGDVFEKSHDELDIEFLGNIKGKPWRFQTNVYGNGSTPRGREERYTLWFDPAEEYHRYSILWTAKNVIFYVDEVPIREVVWSEAMGGDYPSKPMSLYATIWDASDWATAGGKHKVNYKYAPFAASFRSLVLDGCQADPIEEVSESNCYENDPTLEAKDFATITPERRRAMRRFRERYMYYSYCYDTLRYPVPMPECDIIPSEKQRFKDTGRLKFGGSHKRRSRRKEPVPMDPDYLPYM